MQIAVLGGTIAIVFLALDFLMLRNIIEPYFRERLGDHLLDSIRTTPAVMFYLSYVAGVVWFAALPALREGGPGQAAVNGLLLGGLAYATYELTNHATLARWTWGMVALDLGWGAIVTGLSAAAGVLVTRAVFGQ